MNTLIPTSSADNLFLGSYRIKLSSRLISSFFVHDGKSDSHFLRLVGGKL